MPIYNTPLINGNRFQHSSIIFAPLAVPIVGIKAISYNQEKKGGEVFGAGVVKNAETRGQLKPSLNFELYKEEWSAFYEMLAAAGAAQGGIGPYDVRFLLPVSRQEIQNGLPVIITDKCVGVRIVKPDESSSEGTDAHTVKVDTSLFWIQYNGIPPLSLTETPLV